MFLRQKTSLVVLFIMTVVFAAMTLSAAEEDTALRKEVKLGNEFITIRVNPGPQEAGRFAVDTTGGDPSRAADNDQPLIYGSREPWTSYTTLLVDEEPFLFGGTTDRRAGDGFAVGKTLRAPSLTGEVIECAVKIGEIEVTQELSLTRGPTTRVRDTARITYRISNKGASSRRVGLRLVLDTMLGENDGAPLRAGERAISGAARFLGEGIPDFWQAFDTLGEPKVISQGTLRGEALDPPGRVIMADWGTMAAEPWDFDFQEGAEFTRLGEEERDTAVALYWEPRTLEAGETVTYTTLYGVGGVSLSPAQLSLGITAPAEVNYNYDQENIFQVIAYVENSGGFESRKTVCELGLPQGLVLVKGEPKVVLGLLKPAETRQIVWKVAATGEATGVLKMSVSVVSENLEANRVEREVLVNGPPRLEMNLTAPKGLIVGKNNHYLNNPFEMKATVGNRGAQPTHNVIVSLSPPQGLELTEPTQMIKMVDSLVPNGEAVCSWGVRATGLVDGKVELSVTARGTGAKAVEAKHDLFVPRLTPELSIYPAQQKVPRFTDYKPTLVPIAVRLAPARDFSGSRITLGYDPAILEPLYVSRGEAFVDNGRLCSPWSAGRMEVGKIEGIYGERSEAEALNVPETTLFTVVFIAKGIGKSYLKIEESGLTAAGGGEIEHIVLEGSIFVKAEEESR